MSPNGSSSSSSLSNSERRNKRRSNSSRKNDDDEEDVEHDEEVERVTKKPSLSNSLNRNRSRIHDDDDEDCNDKENDSNASDAHADAHAASTITTKRSHKKDRHGSALVAPSPPTLDEEPENANNEEEEEEEDAMENTTTDTATTTSKATTSTNSTGESAGIVKSIYCENFMCHRKLRVELNRNVNFIHGQNGSGKSAVLAAIQICLGAGARRTHRARNLKDLVRKDSTTSAAPPCAKIRVTLSNAGSDAYCPAMYGDAITVERTIALTGGYNGYKLLDHKGVEKSRAKKDLDDMLDTLNIQVDNPVAVLDQEEAKKFLTGKAEDKYLFFMKATELERVDRTFHSIVESIEEMKNINERSTESLQPASEHVSNLRKMWKEHQELKKLEDKHMKSCAEFAWAVYTEFDTNLEKSVVDKAHAEEKVRKKEEDLRLAEEEVGSPGDEETKRQSKVDTLLAEVHSEKEVKKELDEELKLATAPYKESERKLAMAKRAKSEVAGQLKKAERELQNAHDQIAANAESAESEEFRLKSALKQTEEECAAARSNTDELKENQSQWLRSYEEIAPHVQDAKSKVEDLKHQLRGVRNTVASLQSSTGQDSLALLGPRVAKLADLVARAQQQNKFRGPVLGPVASFLKIVPGKEEFAAVAEFALGSGTLDRFIVTNDSDSAVIRKLRSDAGCYQDCGIFQVAATSNRFSIPPKPNMEGIETVASVLTVENDIVFNCLVDNCRIETIGLARDRKDSENKLLVRNGNGSSIRGSIKKVYLPNGDNWTVKGGAFAVFSNEKRLRQTIGVDSSAAIEGAKAEEEAILHTLRLKEQEESKLQHDHTKSQREWNQAKKAVQKNDSYINDLSMKIDGLRQEIDASANFTVDTSEFEEMVQEAQDALASHVSDEQKYSSELESLHPKVLLVREKLDSWTLRNSKALEDVNAAENDLTQFLETQTQQMDQLEKKRRKLKTYQDNILKWQQDITQIENDREAALAKARIMQFRYNVRPIDDSDDENHVSDRSIKSEPTDEDLQAIPPQKAEREPKYYQVRMQKTKEKIEKESARRKVSREDASVAFERYKRAERELDAKMTDIENTEAKIKEMNLDVENRQARWEDFRGTLAKNIGLKFDQMLALNKYTGTLDFNHECHTLDLAVQKTTSVNASQSKDVKALSGGERSYTTMALLIAMGETLETPFRILDEFDVFLDAETRKLVISSLIHVAKTLNHRQFIFITPQDLSSIKPDDQVKILKLNPPDRHQVAGGPSQQTLNFASRE